MRTRIRSEVVVFALLITAVWLGILVSPAAAAPFCRVVAPDGAEAQVRQAGAELSCYLGRLTGGEIPVVGQAEGDAPAIVLRTVPDEKALGDEEYFIEPAEGQRLVVRGRTPLAVAQGAYRLLREYGLGFYFDGDAVPALPPRRFLMPTIHASPVFAIRGSLPWYNFFNSPTTWDDPDFRFFADQILRSGQNFIGFHTYDGEPFAAYEYGGKVVGGEPLLTTEHPVWGTHPLPVGEFGFGTGCLFPGRYWGSDTARMPGSREERIAAQKALLARGLSYASARGIKTCLGFEVYGDPTDPEEQRRFSARLQRLLVDYPMLDYVWIWQPEAASLKGCATPPIRSQGGALYRRWQEAFATIGDADRMWEGMRVAGYGRLGQQILDTTAPSVRLVLSGWGGDHHLHVSDYFPAWDKVLDQRVIFAALDDIVVQPQVSRYYKLSPGRERWAIPWYEFDGDQWFPQANAHVFAQTVRDAREKGCQGLLSIHWRTKEVGESQALAAQYAWNPEETAQSFYRDYAARRAGPEHAAALGDALRELDALGYRWLGGGGQSECAPFAWCHVADAAREKRLLALRERLVKVRRGLRPERCPSGALGRVDDVLATLDRGLLFNQVAGLLIAGGPVDRALAMGPTDPARRTECARVLAELAGPEFGEMLRLWAQTITSRGELGVLATVNAKAFVDYRDKVAALRKACGQVEDTRALVAADSRHRGMVSDIQQTTVAAGTPLMVRCAAFEGGRPAPGVVLEYRTPGDRKWASLPMRNTERCVFEATLPASTVKPGWIRYRIAARLGRSEIRWPECRGEAYRQVHVFEAGTLVARHNPVETAPAQAAREPRLAAHAAAPGVVGLTWERGKDLPEVSVERRAVGDAGWKRLGSTLDWEWEDAAAPPDADLEYRLLDPGGAQLGVCTARTPAPLPPSPPAGLAARSRGTSVRLQWGGADLSVSTYSVERAAAPEGPFEPITPEGGVRPRGFGACLFVDRPRQGGTLHYRVRAHGLNAGDTRESAPVAVSTLAKTPEPLVDLDFEGSDVQAPTGAVEFSGPHRLERVDGRGVLRTEGGLAVPYGEAIGVKGPFTMAVRFRQSERTAIPVLVCQGAWEGPGYFVQLYGQGLRFYVGGAGYLDTRAEIGPGQWHTAVCVYDGSSLATYLDGGLLGEQPAVGAMKPATLPFTVARYCQVGPEWTFKGDVDFVRLYPGALEPWMVMRRRPAEEPVVDLRWDSPEVRVGESVARWHQEPKLADTPQGRAADLSGGLSLPFSDLLAVGDRITLETRFLLRSVEGMPVLLNQGNWPEEGYMLQILGKRIRFHVGGAGSLDCGPTLEADRWYDVKCTYDGSRLKVWLDGAPVGEMLSEKPINTSWRPLRVGRYESDGAAYQVDGLIGPTRIYAAER